MPHDTGDTEGFVEPEAVGTEKGEAQDHAAQHHRGEDTGAFC